MRTRISVKGLDLETLKVALEVAEKLVSDSDVFISSINVVAEPNLPIPVDVDLTPFGGFDVIIHIRPDAADEVRSDEIVRFAIGLIRERKIRDDRIAALMQRVYNGLAKEIDNPAALDFLLKLLHSAIMSTLKSAVMSSMGRPSWARCSKDVSPDGPLASLFFSIDSSWILQPQPDGAEDELGGVANRIVDSVRRAIGLVGDGEEEGDEAGVIEALRAAIRLTDGGGEEDEGGESQEQSLSASLAGALEMAYTG